MNIKDKIVKYWTESQLEIKKVAWPTREEMIGSTIATIVISSTVAAFIWVVDLGIGKLVIQLFKILA